MTSRTVIATALLVLASAAPGATATEGNLYESGASDWGVAAPFTATVLPGPVWQIRAPALAPAVAGNTWEMNWRCPVPGSEIAVVRFGGLRTQAPSSLAVSVLGNRHVLWQEGDAAMPVSPAGGRAYHLPLPPGHCDVHLALTQVETRNQHARGYFIDNPRVAWRDLTAPRVAIRGVTSGWIGAGGAVRVDWSASDNFGSDGIAAQHVIVAGRGLWSGAPGAGDHGLTLGLADVPDGVHSLQVRADGDGTAAGTAAATVHIDRTPPSAAAVAAVTTTVPGLVSARWQASDNLSGVATGTLEVNSAPDGSASGTWRSVGSAHGPGVRTVSGTTAGMADGHHAWRVRTADAAGNVAISPGPGTLVVDTTPPSLELHGVPADWVAAAALDVTAADNMEPSFGAVPVEVDVNTAADGTAAGAWQRRGAAAGPAGRRSVPVDLAGLESGRHLVRVTARNGGGLGAALATERRTVLRVDRDPPVIERLTASGDDGATTSVAWLAGDAHSGLATASLQWRHGGTWRTLATEPTGDGAGSMTVDVAALPRVERVVRLVLTDAAGNATTRIATGSPSPGDGANPAAGEPPSGLPDARLTLRIAGARPVRRADRATLVRVVRAGRPLVVRGRLTDGAGRALPGRRIQARGFRGAVVGRATTRRDGTFVIVARPMAGGPLRIGVPVQGRLLPERPSADVVVRLRPVVELSASATMVAAGGRLLFAGRIAPAPRALGLGGRKGVVLEWRDPIRGAWRPVVNARIRPDGTFAVPWRFALHGLTIPMRVTVPAEVGWPLEPVRSRVVSVRVTPR
jgi:hypothetical protein